MLEQEAVRVTCSTGDTRCHTPGMGTARQAQRWGCQTDPAAGVDVAMRARAHVWIQGGQGKPHTPGGTLIGGFPPAFASTGLAGPCFQPHRETAQGCTHGAGHGGVACVGGAHVHG